MDYNGLTFSFVLATWEAARGKAICIWERQVRYALPNPLFTTPQVSTGLLQRGSTQHTARGQGEIGIRLGIGKADRSARRADQGATMGQEIGTSPDRIC